MRSGHARLSGGCTDSGPAEQHNTSDADDSYSLTASQAQPPRPRRAAAAKQGQHPAVAYPTHIFGTRAVVANTSHEI